MKRVVLSFPFFVLTLLIGSFLAPNLVREMRNAVTPTQTTFRYISWSYTSLAETYGFDPEFCDLPNLSELEYPDSDTLIDLVQFQDGKYRESEVRAKNGENWLVLVDQGGKQALVSKKAKVQRLNTNSWPGDEKDVHLSFDGPGDQILAIRNIVGLRPGPVDSGYRKPSQEEIDRLGLDDQIMEATSVTKTKFEVGTVSKMEFNGKQYLLRASTGLSGDGSALAVLVLQTEELTQVIYSTPYIFGERSFVGNFQWAGDLDRDGKLDLYFEPYNEKGGLDSQLYLSSRAGKDELVKIVSIFGVMGC